MSIFRGPSLVTLPDLEPYHPLAMESMVIKMMANCIAFGRGDMASCFNAVSAAAPVFRRSYVDVVDHGNGDVQWVTRLPNSKAAWTAIEGPAGSAIYTAFPPRRDLTELMIRDVDLPIIQRMRRPWLHADVKPGDPYPGLFVEIFGSAQRRMPWEIPGLAHLRPDDYVALPELPSVRLSEPSSQEVGESPASELSAAPDLPSQTVGRLTLTGVAPDEEATDLDAALRSDAPVQRDVPGSTASARGASSTPVQDDVASEGDGPRTRSAPMGKRVALFGFVALAAVVILSVAVVSSHRTPSSAPARPDHHAGLAGFSGLHDACGIAVDYVGNVFVTENAGDASRVLQVTTTSASPTVLPVRVQAPTAVAVDSTGSAYVAEGAGFDKVVELGVGATHPIDLPFGELRGPRGLAIDEYGTVYVADTDNHRVLKLLTGGTTATVLPLGNLVHPIGVAVGPRGVVYILDGADGAVVTFDPSGNVDARVPFPGVVNARGIAVDAHGTIYVADEGTGRVLALPLGSAAPRPLAPTFDRPCGLAIGPEGAVYVADSGPGRIVKVPPAGA